MVSGSGATKSGIALTARSVEALHPEKAPYRVPDIRCPGLAIRVATSGVKTWDMSYRIKGGQVRRRSLGRFPEVGLAEARERANDLAAAARGGRDLVGEEDAAQVLMAARPTIAELIERYCHRRVRGRLRTAVEIERRLKRALLPVLTRYADDLRRRDLRELLDAVADAGMTREAEARRQSISTMFRWAISVDLIETNPIWGLPTYDAGQARSRVLSADEVRTAWHWFASSNMLPSHVAALRLQLCIGARIGEIGGMARSEIDSNWVWHLPAERSKNGSPRATPLDGLAKDIVMERLNYSTSELLFESERGAAATASQIGGAIIKRRKDCPIESFATHDLRRTAATSMAELGISLETIATIVGHSAGNAATHTLLKHYIHTQSIKIKRDALDIWNSKLREIIRAS
ncbi:Site-specific recombinase XerD [Kaistia soli DSM 19436]|uniref:Site-specific recombinase XerD n=1 Tax=Kaistia soli DSM 19436 TaxID=1122133 RepID=A0A1M5LBM9_9HYPH|nr:integrase family protein [Kaistia soli]SHG62441.1 Site-specific recombinase XerD [Kaistia soli DSM 19436]